MNEAEHLWTLASANVREQLPDATWKTWLESVHPVGLDGEKLRLAVPSLLVKERIQARYLQLILGALQVLTGRPVGVELDVRIASRPDHAAEAEVATLQDGGDETAPRPAAPGAEPAQQQAARQHGARQQGARQATAPTPLNPRYTFEAFVTGISNRFAHAAAQAVAETPAKSYNPLFIYGVAGLGKTHLLHAIGNYVAVNYPSHYVRYVSTETFLSEFVDGIRTNTMPAFKRRYRECDVLLVDDIQFMETREGLQEEFFHTFNSLYGASKQIVITSDRPPGSIATLEDRLRSRFLSGLTTDIQPPDLETRLAILSKKAEAEPKPVPKEVLEFIASNIRDNIRELEGALIRVCAFATLNREPLDVGIAERVLADIMSGDVSRSITPQMILQATADTFGFTVDDLCGTSRRRPLVIARQIGMYVFRQLTDFSYPAIAREFGGRDHTTVIHAVDKISALMKARRQIYDQVTDLILSIKNAR